MPNPVTSLTRMTLTAAAATTDLISPTLSPRERWRTYVLCLLGWLFDFYDMFLFAYLANAISHDWNWGTEAHHNKALIIGITLGTSGFGGIVFGGLSDRYGRRRVMGWTILLYSISTGLCGLSWDLTSLVFFRALTGLGVGGEWATGHALMAEIFPKERRGLASALLQAGEPLGGAIAVGAGLFLEPRLGEHGWRWVFVLSATPAFLVLLIRRYVNESPLWLTRHLRSELGLLEQYQVLFRDYWRPAVLGWVLGVSKLGTFWLTYVWLPEYFMELDKHNRDAGVTSGGDFASIRLQFILLAQAGQFLGMLMFGPLADRIGRRPAFTIYSLLTAAGLFALSYYGAEMLAKPNWFWLTMGAVGIGSGCTAGFGALLAELFPTSIRNTAMGTVYNMARSFQIFNQLVMGLIVSQSSVSHGLLLAMSLALVTATWVWTLPETRGIALRAD